MRNHNTKRGAERRPRLSLDTYDAGRELQELLAAPDLPAETRALLLGKLYDLLRDTDALGAQPDTARAAFLGLCHTIADAPDRAAINEANKRRLDLRQWIRSAHGVHFGRDGGGRLALTGKRPDELPDESPAEMPETEAPAAVVRIGAWLDSHPRPIRNLLFAEKGGGRD